MLNVWSDVLFSIEVFWTYDISVYTITLDFWVTPSKLYFYDLMNECWLVHNWWISWWTNFTVVKWIVLSFTSKDWGWWPKIHRGIRNGELERRRRWAEQRRRRMCQWRVHQPGNRAWERRRRKPGRRRRGRVWRTWWLFVG